MINIHGKLIFYCVDNMAFEFLSENLKNLQTSIAEICGKCQREVSEVTLLPVTKRQPLEKLQALYDLGERHFAENRVQEMLEKAEVLPKDLVWHLIGPLQSNKVRHALSYASYIHSVDSIKLLNRIERIAQEDGKEVKVFLQINITGEEQKSGFAEADLDAALKVAESFLKTPVVGLMTMGAVSDSEEETKEVFSKLRELRDKWQIEYPELKQLSMGMSGDYQLAIPEGATYIRVGSLLLGNREY